MSLIDDLRKIGATFPPSHTPSAGELPGVVGALVTLIEHGPELLQHIESDFTSLAQFVSGQPAAPEPAPVEAPAAPPTQIHGLVIDPANASASVPAVDAVATASDSAADDAEAQEIATLKLQVADLSTQLQTALAALNRTTPELPPTQTESTPANPPVDPSAVTVSA